MHHYDGYITNHITATNLRNAICVHLTFGGAAFNNITKVMAHHQGEKDQVKHQLCLQHNGAY